MQTLQQPIRAQPVLDHLVELDALVGDEDDLVPVGPTETQDVDVLHLRDETKSLHVKIQTTRKRTFKIKARS